MTDAKKSAQQPLNAVLNSLGILLNKLYREHPSLVTISIVILLFCFYLIVKSINSGYFYSIAITFLFTLLSVSLYIKEKNSINAIFSFSMGIFTAFVVEWNGFNFAIFFISIIILIVVILFISSIRMAAKVEERITTAASFYINNFETNKKILHEVAGAVNDSQGLLPIDKRWDALLFFAYQKVPKDRMITLIDALNQLYTVTKVNIDSLLILLNNINLLSDKENDLKSNIIILQNSLLEGKSTPNNLVSVLNDSLHILIENKINFNTFIDTIFSYLTRGYTSKRIVEKLTTRFSRKV